MLKKIVHKIREGALRDILRETRWIYTYAARYRREILLFILLGLLATALGLGSSVASKYLIDAVTGHDTGILVSTACMYAGFSVFRILFGGVSRRISARLSVRASNEIRADVFGKFLNVDWQASLDYHSGDLLSRVNGDVGTVAGSILGWVPSLVTGLVQFIATLAVILVYDPIMAVIALLSAPVTVLLSRVLVRKMRDFNKRVREMEAGLMSFYEESLQNLQAIKSFHLNGKFTGRLSELQELYKGISLDYNLFSVKTNLLMSLVGFAVASLCFAWAVYRLWTGMISFGTMTLFIQLAGAVSSAFSSLVGLVPSAISATVAAGRIMTILDLPKEELEATEEEQRLLDAAAENGVSLRVENVDFAYRPGHSVLSGFSLEAEPGEIIGIVSPSGGGKTTLIRMLLGLIFPSAGRVELRSGDYTAALSPCMRPLITYVAQEKVVFSGTIAESLQMCDPAATEEEMLAALETACARDFVEKLPRGLYTALGERGAGLSEGQIQRLAIARAVLSSAPVMLLDEATSALDMETERKVLTNLLREGKRRTVLVTTHRPTVLSSCDRIYAIREGHSAILTAEEVQDLLRPKTTLDNE